MPKPHCILLDLWDCFRTKFPTRNFFHYFRFQTLYTFNEKIWFASVNTETGWFFIYEKINWLFFLYQLRFEQSYFYVICLKSSRLVTVDHFQELIFLMTSSSFIYRYSHHYHTYSISNKPSNETIVATKLFEPNYVSWRYIIHWMSCVITKSIKFFL